jgi:hypothetical protein
MRTSKRLIVGLALAALAHEAFADPTVTRTEVVGPFTGHDAKLHPENAAPNRIAYYGTDLGFSYGHQGEIHFLFGDTWASEAYAPIQPSTAGRYDDSFGSIDLKVYSKPRRISPNHIPLIKLGQIAGTTEMAAINPGHAMDLGKTPMAGFSNGSREFGLFNVTKPLGCRLDKDCGGGLTCDTGLGFLGAPFSKEEGLTLPCVDGDRGCSVDTLSDSAGAAIPGSGFCTDRTSTIYANTPMGRISATALQQRVGLRSLSDPRQFTDVQRWLTNKFVNATARTVNDFRPERGPGASHQDYANASGAGKDRRVLIWGRPGFVGVASKQRTLGVYFAYTDLPAGPGFSWTLHYYTGSTAAGAPQFSTNETDAVALDLDSRVAGVQSAEPVDVVNQVSIAWIESLKKWVMFYGGGLSTLPSAALPHCGVLELFAGRECKDVVIGNGAVHMRTADDPWGPWSPPQDVVIGGDPAVAGSGLYRPGGMLRHPACTSAGCATPTQSAVYHPEEYGFLYGTNIIEQWTQPVGAGVDVLWNASTWDPYRVILLRTRIDP